MLNIHPPCLYLPLCSTIAVPARTGGAGPCYEFSSAVRPRRLIVPVDETTSDINTLQSDILDIIGRSSIITPDDLRGNASTLQAALITSGG